MATALLVIAACVPWWLLTTDGVLAFGSSVVVTDVFSGWGWLSFTAGLVVLALIVRLLVPGASWPTKKLGDRTLASSRSQRE